jgi:hypothetical protein
VAASQQHDDASRVIATLLRPAIVTHHAAHGKHSALMHLTFAANLHPPRG